MRAYEVLQEQEISREKQKALFNKARTGTEVLYSGPEGKIVIPKTLDASRFWGLGTDWFNIRGFRSGRTFNNNNEHRPLYIIITKDNKYQFHLHTNSLLDGRNEKVDFGEFDKKYPWVFDKLNSVWTEDYKRNVVNQAGETLQFIKNPSEEVQRLALQNNGWAIQFIKNPSEELKRLAVQSNGLAIQHIKNPSEEVQRLAVQNDGDAIQHIKNPLPVIQQLHKEHWGSK